MTETCKQGKGCIFIVDDEHPEACRKHPDVKTRHHDDGSRCLGSRCGWVERSGKERRNPNDMENLVKAVYSKFDWRGRGLDRRNARPTPGWCKTCNDTARLTCIACGHNVIPVKQPVPEAGEPTSLQGAIAWTSASYELDPPIAYSIRAERVDR